MRVFKACITIMKRRALTFIVYLIVFLLLCVVITAMSAQKSGGGFEAVKPTYTFINRDTDSELIRGLKAYLDTHASEVPLADEKEALQDASFFHASDYILIVPQGFAASVYGGDARPLQTVTVPDSANGYYVDRLVNQYLRLDRNYALARPDESAMDAPNIPNEPRDASSASCIASALYEISTMDVPDANSYKI